MSRQTAPADSDLLCEQCGYTLNGLPLDSRCPECGKPIAESIGYHRHSTPWEKAQTIHAFIITTCQVIFRPRFFFRSMLTRSDRTQSRRFEIIQYLASSILLASAGMAHFNYQLGLLLSGDARFWGLPIFTVLICILLSLSAPLAAWLSAWEASYRGYRLPYATVRHAMDYLSATFLPVAMIAFLTINSYLSLVERSLRWEAWASVYIWTLAAEVVLGAAYLFHSYWIAMKSIMYANR